MTAHVLSTNPEQENDNLLVSVTIPPREMQRVDIGEFETEELIPKVAVEYQADDWNTVEGVVNRKTMEDGSIRLFLVAQNFGPQPATVLIHRDDR